MAPESPAAEPAVPTISVVIPTRGRPARVAQTLEAVLADPATSEAVVVVDGHDPETTDALLTYARNDDRVRIAHAPATSGAPRGEQRVRDHGARIASSEVILALDDDIVAASGLVSGHAGWHATAGDLVVLGYMPIAPPPDGHRWTAATRLYAESYERACDEFDADPHSILAGLWGGNFSVRREHWLMADALEAVAVGFVHTDREFGLRLGQLGLRGRFDRGLSSVHHDVRDVSRLAEAARGSAVARMRFDEAHQDRIPTDGQMGNRYARKLVVALLVVTRPPLVWGSTLWMITQLTRGAYAVNFAAVEYALIRLVWRLAYERELANSRDAERLKGN